MSRLTAFRRLPTLWDIEARLKLLDEFDDIAQVLSLANPPIEMMGPPERTPEIARIANDGLAELVHKYPERFPAFIASMPMNNVPACLAEIERAIGQLGARGIQIFTNVLGTPLSAPALSADLPRHGQARPAGVDPPDPRPELPRLCQRDGVGGRDLVHLRLALRDDRGGDAPHLFRHL